MKKYKLVDQKPLGAGALAAAAGASMGAGDAGSPTHALINAGIGFAVGSIAGGIAARKDRKAHNALNEQQFGKK